MILFLVTQGFKLNTKNSAHLGWGGVSLPFTSHCMDADNNLLLTVDLSQDFIGWECLGVNKILDLSKRKSYRPMEFF